MKFRPKYQDEHGNWCDNNPRDPQPESIKQVVKILRDGSSRGALLTDEQGLGKTATAIVSAYTLGLRRVLVVSPKNTIAVWKAEIERWQANPDIVIELTERHTIDPDTVNRGWLLCSYDTVGRYFPPGKRATMRPFDLLIVDECQHLKEPKIKRTRMVYGGFDKKSQRQILPIPSRKSLLLSGTPIKNRIEEIQTALAYVHPDIYSDRDAFVEQHHEPGYVVDNRGRVTGTTRNLDTLRTSLLSSILVRHRKDGLLLPKKFKCVYLNLEDLGELSLVPKFEELDKQMMFTHAKMRRALREGDWRVYAQLKDQLSRQQARARELTGHAKYVPLLKYMLDRAKNTDKKTVLFLHHDDMITDMANTLRRAGYGCVTLTGDTKDSRVPRQIFKHDDTRFFIGNLQAAGVGITLVESSHCVLGEIPWTPAEWMQAQDRLHRFGQEREVTVMTFLLREGFDGSMFDAVRSKTRTLRRILDNDWEHEPPFVEKIWHTTDDGFELRPMLRVV